MGRAHAGSLQREPLPDTRFREVRHVPDEPQGGHLLQQGHACRRQAAGSESLLTARHAAPVGGVAIRQPDHPQPALPPAWQVADLHDRVGPFHEQDQAGLAILLPQVEVQVEIRRRLEQADAPCACQDSYSASWVKACASASSGVR